MFSFPFPELRPGQEEIINAVTSAIKCGGKLMIHASTGMGKTAPVVYAALKSAKEKNLRVVFLTAKHTHQNIVYETIRKINDASSEEVTFTGINGKRSMCLFENNAEPSIFIEFCRAVREQGLCDFYKNTFSKSKELKPRAIEALNVKLSDPESIMNAGRKFEVCPYEISLLNAKRSDIIVANYAHLFDPDVSQSFLAKVDLDPKKTIMIVDEAHNLHNKIIDMNSFTISLRTLERAYSEATFAGERGIADKIDSIISLARKVQTEMEINLKEVFTDSDLESINSIVKKNEKGYNVPASFTLGKFAAFLLQADEYYLQYVSKENEHIRVNVFALDPSGYAKKVINSFASSIFISGTLKPIEMFENLLGIPEAEKLIIESDEMNKNRLVINETDLTSKFSNRSSQFKPIAERIDEILESFHHNMIIFFPSYFFMESVFKLLGDKKRVIKEEPKIDRETKQKIISDLYGPGKCLFAVIGGNFSESIGMKNNVIRLIVVVGIPFEPPSIRLRAVQNYYQKKFSDGFEYAQVLPSMIKVMQAAGRGIRSSKDKAAILLIDSRLKANTFRKYLPTDIKTVNGSPTEVINEEGFN
jgi:DNA excision repair protein ERCC-2